MSNKREQELEDYIYEICDIIYMECPLEQQDAWLKAMRQRGLYDPYIEGMSKECCRNGCERCEQ